MMNEVRLDYGILRRLRDTDITYLCMEDEKFKCTSRTPIPFDRWFTERGYPESERDYYRSEYGCYGPNYEDLPILLTKEDIEVRICREIFKCEQCGNYMLDLIVHNGKKICDACYGSIEVECSECGDMIVRRESIDADGEIYCETCYDEKFANCDSCGNRELLEDLNEYNHGDLHICNSCNTQYYECEDCGEVMHEDRMRWDDDSDCWYCESCYDDHHDSCECEGSSNEICGYHGFRSWVPRYLGHEAKIFMGWELEVERTNSNIMPSDMARKVKEIMNQDVICSYDGSLSNGFEIVSHPMTYEYMLTKQANIQEMLKYLRDNGYRSHNPGTCGLHIHLSRDPLCYCIDNILITFENFMEELILFSRRKSNQIQQWSQFISTYKQFDGEVLTLKYISDNKDASSRYMAVNLQNAKTIELRLFRGTLNFNTFMATFTLVNNMVNYVTTNESIEGLTWRKLVGNNPRIRDYCKSRGIVSSKKATNNIIKKSNTKLQTTIDKDMEYDDDTINSITSENVAYAVERGMEALRQEPNGRVVYVPRENRGISQAHVRALTEDYAPYIWHNVTDSTGVTTTVSNTDGTTIAYMDGYTTTNDRSDS